MAQKSRETREAGKNTKERIFLAAAELFAENGYKGVSMNDIAKKCGIKSASIYNHYESKERIMDELLDYYLNRMEVFYKRLRDMEIDAGGQKNLGAELNKLMLAYEADERQLMYCLTRIVHHEQFNYHKAADAIIGSGYRKYVSAHIHYFDRLSDAGFIRGKENNRYYGEIYARLSLTFATQFLHPEIEPTIEVQTELSDFMNKLIFAHQESLIRKGKA